MANIKSAKKRIKVINRQKNENKFFKASVNTGIKKFKKLISEGKLTEAEAKLKELTKLIQSSASKGIYHKNNASRKIARLSKALHNAKLAKGEVAAPAKKAEPKAEVKAEAKVEAKTESKPATKKAPAKKASTTTAKKATTTAKKPAAKKTTTSTAKKASTTTAKKPAAKKATTAKKAD